MNNEEEMGEWTKVETKDHENNMYDISYDKAYIECPNCESMNSVIGILLNGEPAEHGGYEPGCDECGFQLELAIRATKIDNE